LEKIKKIQKNLPPVNGDPLKLLKRAMANRNCSFQLGPVHPELVKQLLSTMKSSHTCGADQLDSYVIKLCGDIICPALTHIFNLSILTQTFPQDWKLAKVVPIHKGGDKITMKNFRPVSLLVIMGKLLEKVIAVQTINYIEENELLPQGHHGFRAGLSTTTALLEIVETWLENLEEGRITGVILIDLSAAFDCVDWVTLDLKLEAYGFMEDTRTWFRSYLKDRKQSVRIEAQESQELDITTGVPQGSILGPLLYILFTGDLPEVIHTEEIHGEELVGGGGREDCKNCGNCTCYADDSTISISDKDHTVIQKNMECVFGEVVEYMGNNRLQLNSDKTHLLVIASSKGHSMNGDYGIKLNTGNEVIDATSTEKLLGGHIKDDLSWTFHISELIKTLAKKITALQLVAKWGDFRTRKIIGAGIIQSYLGYLAPVWGGCPVEQLNLLQRTQNRALRIITGRSIYTPISELLKETGWMSVRQLVSYHSILVLRSSQALGKPKFLLRKIQTVGPRNTRLRTSANIYPPPKPKKDVRRRGLLCRTIPVWNQLPKEMVAIEKHTHFKSLLKEWVRKNVGIN
jgi:hypothetical protein